MQQRYCICGHMVLVRYFSQNGSWKPLFITCQRLPGQQKISVVTCPNCGAPLSIHTLQ